MNSFKPEKLKKSKSWEQFWIYQVLPHSQSNTIFHKVTEGTTLMPGSYKEDIEERYCVLITFR